MTIFRKIPTKDTVAMLDRCGVDNYGFYDRRGDYFREGINPRNYFGRFVRMEPRSGWAHDYNCPAGFSDRSCDCGAPINA